MDGMKKVINTQEDSNINVYNEKLLQTEKSFCKSFSINIISKRKVLVKASLNIDLQNFLLNITTDNNLTISIKFADLLAIIRLDEKDTRDISDQLIKNSKRLITEETLSGNVITNLNFFPLYVVSKCNCCGWMICQCREIIRERRAKNVELLIPFISCDEIIYEINKILYAERNVLYKEVDVNKKRRLLLYVNPIGGKGSAITIWNRIKNLFNLADIQIDVFRTQHYHHAYEHTLDMNFKKYDGVLCCSGDGIVHEVINAIFHRPDKDEFINSCPIGVIPGGTSNGFAKSICESSEEPCSPESCAFIVAKGQVKSVDIVELETFSEEGKIYCFLGVAWGIIADIDLESETCRCCGPLRFSIYGALRWMCLRNVYGAFYYLPENSEVSDDKLPNLREPLEPGLGMVRENDQFTYFWACNISHGGETINVAPKAKLDDGFMDIIKMKKSAGRANLLMQLFNQDSGDYFDHIGDFKEGSGLEYVKTKFWRLIPKENVNDSDDSTINRNLSRFYSIDGERYPVEPIQGKTLKKSLRIFCINK